MTTEVVARAWHPNFFTSLLAVAETTWHARPASVVPRLVAGTEGTPAHVTGDGGCV
jgi:hypothetical protein